MNDNDKDEDHQDHLSPQEEVRYCCCCSDRICIWISWIVFIIIIAIFIFGMIFKYRKDDANEIEPTNNNETP